jgi:DNA-binding HxlR family transcriptional regulator
MDNQADKKKFYFHGHEYYCSLDLAMDVIGGKWKTMMIYHLMDGAVRSSVLQRSLIGISNKMFTQVARELEHDGIIERIVYPVVPPKVEYKLSPVGITVIPLIKNMVEWGESMSEASE